MTKNISRLPNKPGVAAGVDVAFQNLMILRGTLLSRSFRSFSKAGLGMARSSRRIGLIGSLQLVTQGDKTRAATLSAASKGVSGTFDGPRLARSRGALSYSNTRIYLGGAAWIAGVLLSSSLAEAQNVPDVVKLPSGINLGSSSFYDGFGSTDPGWTSLNYLRWDAFRSIKDGSGQNSQLFVNPRIDAISSLFHVVYVPPVALPNGALAFEALLPIVDFQSHFNVPGVLLHDNGLGAGDMTLGAAYQSKPMTLGTQCVLSWRFDLDVTAPTGGFSGDKDLNQGSGFWSISPYIAATLLPIPKWELSARFNYIYNFSTSRASDPPQVPGFVFHNGQAGQAGWINFASSYEVAEGVRPGVNGFWLRQFTNDNTNGISVPGTRVEELYLGPGLEWVIDKRNMANINAYFPISAANAAAGAQFNLQYVHQF
jgi:hypothetical protein